MHNKIDPATVAPILVRDRSDGGIHLTTDERDLVAMKENGARTLCGRRLKPVTLFNESDTEFFHTTGGLCTPCDESYASAPKVEDSREDQLAA